MRALYFIVRALSDRLLALEKRLSVFEDLTQGRHEDSGTRITNIDTGVTEAQDATCELSEEVDMRISDLENAICELSEAEVK
jgi:hypothetical protein